MNTKRVKRGILILAIVSIMGCEEKSRTSDDPVVARLGDNIVVASDVRPLDYELELYRRRFTSPEQLEYASRGHRNMRTANALEKSLVRQMADRYSIHVTQEEIQRNVDERAKVLYRQDATLAEAARRMNHERSVYLELLRLAATAPEEAEALYEKTNPEFLTRKGWESFKRQFRTLEQVEALGDRWPIQSEEGITRFLEERARYNLTKNKLTARLRAEGELSETEDFRQVLLRRLDDIEFPQPEIVSRDDLKRYLQNQHWVGFVPHPRDDSNEVDVSVPVAASIEPVGEPQDQSQ